MKYLTLLLLLPMVTQVQLDQEPHSRSDQQAGPRDDTVPKLLCPMPVYDATVYDPMPIPKPDPSIKYFIRVVPPRCVNPLAPRIRGMLLSPIEHIRKPQFGDVKRLPAGGLTAPKVLVRPPDSTRDPRR